MTGQTLPTPRTEEGRELLNWLRLRSGISNWGHERTTICAIEDAAAAPYVAALREIAEFAEAHHGDQPGYLFLHALTVDIPERVRVALSGAATEPGGKS